MKIRPNPIPKNDLPPKLYLFMSSHQLFALKIMTILKHVRYHKTPQSTKKFSSFWGSPHNIPCQSIKETWTINHPTIVGQKQGLLMLDTSHKLYSGLSSQSMSMPSKPPIRVKALQNDKTLCHVYWFHTFLLNHSKTKCHIWIRVDPLNITNTNTLAIIINEWTWIF